MPHVRHVVIVGGGFGGVKTAESLKSESNIRITLISMDEYFQYYPALYSTATGRSHKQSWVRLDAMFKRQSNLKLVHDTVIKIDPDKKEVSSATSVYKYDQVILALGSVTTYFGIEGLDTYAYGIKSHEEIRRLQKHLLSEMDDGKDDEKNYVIIGAGPTGVELAGALGSYISQLRLQYGIKKQRVRIVLIEAAPRVLPRLSEKSSRAAHARLESLGVIVEVNKKVERQTADTLIVNGKPLMSQTVIWTSGVTTAPFYRENATAIALNERGKVIVDEYMQARKDVYVIGDNAATPYAGLAQTALHDAQFVAKHIKGSRTSYSAVLPPCVIPIGEHWALFEWSKLQFSGRLASLLRAAADIIGYNDVLPLGYAMKSWRAQSKRELHIPDELPRS